MEAVTFRPLEFPFTKRGFLHELVKREGLVCLVRRSRIGHPDIPPHYEVVKLRQMPGRVWPTGQVSPPSEVYPESESWGVYGFTYRTLNKPERKWTALSRYRWLVVENAKRASSRPDGVIEHQEAA
jgi:hypothetical protein